MAWIESHQGLARHLKTKRLARKLGVSIPATIGHLHLLWWWAMDNLPDGNLSLMEPEDVADEMMWSDDPNKLIESLIDSGFIDIVDEKMFIHDWHDYIGRLIEKRRQDTERKRKNREKSKGCPAGQDAEIPQDGARNSTVQYSTVPNQKNTTTNELEFRKVLKAFRESHEVLDMKPADMHELSKLLDDGFTAEKIIDVMNDRRVKATGKVKTFKYYISAIRDSVNFDHKKYRNEGIKTFEEVSLPPLEDWP